MSAGKMHCEVEAAGIEPLFGLLKRLTERHGEEQEDLVLRVYSRTLAQATVSDLTRCTRAWRHPLAVRAAC